MFEDFDDNDPDEDGEPENAATEAGKGLPSPRAAIDALGHGAVEAQLLAAYNDDRLPHALIFTGPSGIGKATFAYRLARFLLSFPSHPQSGGEGRGEGADDAPGFFDFGTAPLSPALSPREERGERGFHIASDQPVFHQVASGGHPDLLVIERLLDEKKGKLQDVVAVDEVRKITPFLRLTASNGGWRVVIVDDADTMNRASQNALLKILEEPPPHTVLILVTHNLGALLPTIRSRARIVNFAAPNAADFAALMRRAAPELGGGDLALLSAIARGSIGGALRLHQQDALATIAQLTALLADWRNLPWPEIHKLAERLGAQGQDEAYAAFAELFVWLLIQLVRAGAGGAALPPLLAKSGAARLQAALSPADLLALGDALRDHFATFDHANLDRRQAVLGAFTLLGKAVL